MAQTISHEAAAQVKDEQNKAALVALLDRAYNQINDLQGQLDALTERIDPAPAPLPDTVTPYRLRNLASHALAAFHSCLACWAASAWRLAHSRPC